jgi:hypothetical protein
MAERAIGLGQRVLRCYGYKGVPMKDEKKPQRDVKKEQQDPAFRKRTDLPGQNPQANDDPSHSEHNDESRQP